jgi:hypothetical protein
MGEILFSRTSCNVFTVDSVCIKLVRSEKFSVGFSTCQQKQTVSLVQSPSVEALGRDENGIP